MHEEDAAPVSVLLHLASNVLNIQSGDLEKVSRITQKVKLCH